MGREKGKEVLIRSPTFEQGERLENGLGKVPWGRQNIDEILLKRSSPLSRGCSSNGRALALHARGTGFDPPTSPLFIFYMSFIFFLSRTIFKDVARMVESSLCIRGIQNLILCITVAFILFTFYFFSAIFQP